MKNPYEICGDQVKIYATNNNEISTLVSRNKFDFLLDTVDRIWVRYDKTINDYYAYCGLIENNKMALLHRHIMQCPKHLLVDHINHSTLDNTDENLKPVTGTQNQLNRKSCQSNNKSGELGVSWNKRTKKYIASIQINKKKRFLGRFDSVEEARNAYKLALSSLL